MVANVISRLASAIIKLSAITKIHKYKGLHEGHHFILMAMEVHGALEHNMGRFIKDYVRLFHDKQLGGRLSLSFCFQFFKQRVNIALRCALAFVIERKITLVGNVCSKPPITIRSHDLHVGNIRGAMGEIASYHKKD